MQKRKWIGLVVVAAPTLYFVWAMLFYPVRNWVILWPRAYNTPLAVVVSIAVCALLYAGLVWWMATRVRNEHAMSRRQRWALMALFILGGLLLQGVVPAASENDSIANIFIRRTYAAYNGGYYSVGAPVTDVADFIRHYAERAPLYPVHQARHPPGLSLVFKFGAWLFSFAPGLAAPVASWMRPQSCLSWVSTAVSDHVMAAGFFGMVFEIVFAMSAVVPLYALVRRVAGQQAAVWSVLLYPLMPGFGMWLSQFDRGLALGTISILYFCERWLSERKARYALLAGFTLSVFTFLSFGAVPTALAAGMYVLLKILLSGKVAGYLQPAVRAVPLALLGIASVWVFVYLAFGLNVVTLYHVVFDSHLGIPFPFYPFVFWHPWDVMTFIGIPIICVVFGLAWRKKSLPLAGAFVFTLVILAVAHVARGETGRVWMWLAPIAVGASAVWVADQSKKTTLLFVLLLALQLTVQASTYRNFVGYGIPPEQLPVFAVPPTATRVDTRFMATGKIALLAYQIEPLKAGATGKITLYWQRMSDEPIETNFKVFIHVAQDENDQARVAKFDAMPMDWKYPTVCWQKNQVVEDIHPLQVDANAPAGEYPVFVGMYDELNDNQRPPTFASPPAKQLYGSVLLPTKAVVTQ